MHKTKLALALLLGLASVPAVAQDIKVGTIFPLSGGAGPDGQTVTNAVKLMVQQINDKGGLLGRKLTVISKDDESTPAVGVSRANEMVAEKADIVIEGWNSPVTLAMQPILARGNILDFTAVSKSDLILSGETNPYAMRINSSNGLDAEVIAKYVAQTMKAKKIAFLTQNDVYGNGFQTAVEAEFKKMNFSGEVIMTEKFAFKDTDFRVQLTNIKGANPDAVIVTSSSNSSGLPALVDQYRQAGIKSTFVGAVGIMLSTVYKVAGDANNGVISADIFFPDLPPFTTQPESVAFVAAYKKAYGVDPDKSARARRRRRAGVGAGGRTDQVARSQDRGRGDPRQARQGHRVRRRPVPAERPDAASLCRVRGGRRQEHQAQGIAVTTAFVPLEALARSSGGRFPGRLLLASELLFEPTGDALR
ncbi:branched-chain amino acid transport system substrate-binding protein [Bradyrhizobium sp. S3.14.4]